MEESKRRTLSHMLYELKKGVRPLALGAFEPKCAKEFKELLERKEISYHEEEISPTRTNIYFGNTTCVEVIRSFEKRMPEFSPEEDFILGTLLGYDARIQSERYLERRLSK